MRFRLLGLVRDLHPLANAYAEHTQKAFRTLSVYGTLPQKNGGYLLSHGCAVPSARAGLTALFGMGRGGTPPL